MMINQLIEYYKQKTSDALDAADSTVVPTLQVAYRDAQAHGMEHLQVDRVLGRADPAQALRLLPHAHTQPGLVERWRRH